MVSEVFNRSLQTVNRLCGFDITLLLIPLTVAGVTAVILFTVRSLVFKVLGKWTTKTHNNVDDLVVSCLKGPSILWCMAFSIHLGLNTSDLPAKYVAYLTRGVDVFIVLSITMAAASLSGRLLDGFLQASSLPLKSTGLMQGVLKSLIFLVGFLFILTSLNVSITPLITTLGVGGLAVALALQDTLANLFAGIHILIEKSIRVGDFIKIDSGEQGYVEDITWRTTRVRMLPNNMVVIPNSKLAKSTVTNYHLPIKRMSLLIPVSVSYSSRPRRVAEILVEEQNNQPAGTSPSSPEYPSPFDNSSPAL
jgi:small-conductance mechanosensitive channel